MIQQITAGIKISVQTKFEGSFLKENILHYAFKYFIIIENQSKHVVQLLTRHWKINEAIIRPSYINGVGIVGKKPILKPGDIHKYQSGSLLTSPMAVMSGIFTMINFSTAQRFNVHIPYFKLNAPHILN